MTSPDGGERSASPQWRKVQTALTPLNTRRPSSRLRRPDATIELEYVSVGCNRAVHCSSWNDEPGPGGGLYAFGAHATVAVYDPAEAAIARTLQGHRDEVTAVRWLRARDGTAGRWLVTGGADGAVLLWHRDDDPAFPEGGAAHAWRVVAAGRHEGPVTAVAAFPAPRASDVGIGVAAAKNVNAVGDVHVIVSASQDGTVRIWRHDLAAPAPAPAPAPPGSPAAAAPPPPPPPLADAGSLTSAPAAAGYLPLALAVDRIPPPAVSPRSGGGAGGASASGSPPPVIAFGNKTFGGDEARGDEPEPPDAFDSVVAVAVGDASGAIRVYLCDTAPLAAWRGDRGRPGDRGVAADALSRGVALLPAERVETLRGHADWVRDLSFRRDAADGSLLLASASQDRTARVWRIRRERPVPVATTGEGGNDAGHGAGFATLAAPPKPPARLFGGEERVACDLEAALRGHEDWVLSAKWKPAERPDAPPALITASMDRSIVVWSPIGGGASGKEPAKEPVEKDAGEKDAARANLDDASLPDGEKPAPEGEADTGAEADASVGLSSAEASVGVSSAASAPPRVWMATESMGEAASSCLGFYGAAFDAAGRRILAHSHGGALHLWRRSDDGTESGDGTESAPGASSTPQSATPQSATPRASSGKPPAVPGGKKSPGRKITVTRTVSTRTVVKRDASSAPETTVVKEVTTTRTVDDDAENAAAVAVVVNGKSSAKTKTNPNPKASSAADPGSAGPGFERTLSTETLGSSDPGEEGEHPENARPPPENAALGPRWVPAPACSGHAGDVACLSWDGAGRFLLTGSGDLTTRLHARWDAEENDDRASIPSSRARGWRQIARPQAHGHAIACVAALPPPRREGGGDSADDDSADDDDDDDDARGGGDDSGTAAAAAARAERKLARLAGSVSFVSGADEKTLRVFEAPGTFLGTMARSLPASDARGRAAFRAAAKRAGDENALGAELPQLGLSNKAVRGAAPEGWLGVDDAPPANDDVAAGATPSRAEKKPSSDAGAGGPFEGSDSPKTPKGGPESADAGEEKPRTPARSPSFLEYLGLASPEPEEKTRAEGEEAAPEGDEEKAGEAGAEAEEEEEEEISAAAFARNPPAAEATHPSKEPSNASPKEAADPSGVSMPAGRSEAAVAAGGAPRGRSDSDSEDPAAEKPPTRSEDPGSEDPGAKKTSPPEQTDPSKNAGEDSGQPHSSSFGRTTPSALSAPPPEEVLAQATLWPESRKLYGHGNDLSCVASHPAGTLVASACKAQSAGAASVWFWDPLDDWKPLGNLPGATLTVVALQFANAKTAAQDMLLAASRDRHVCLYVPASVPATSETGGASGVWGESGWTLATRVKAHAKALLSAAWAPRGAHTFATAGRDKRVRVWAVDEQRAAIAREELPAFDASPTAVAFAPRRVKGRLVLAVGSEDGGIRLFSGGRILIGKDEADGSPTRAPGTAPWLPLASANFFDAHAGAVRALAWRPTVKVMVEAGAGAAGGTGARTTTTGGGDDGSRSGASTRSRGSRASSRGGSPRSLSPSASSLYFGLAGMVLDTEPDEESDEEDVEADEAMTLASCGADRAVRLFSVRRRGGAGGSASSGQREASPFARH